MSQTSKRSGKSSNIFVRIYNSFAIMIVITVSFIYFKLDFHREII